MNNKILIVIVLYNEQLNDSIAYNSLKNNTTNYSFFIYDNSPIDFIRTENALSCKDVYINDYSNSGLSSAYNAAAIHAKERSFDWLLLLDQDTFLPDNLLNIYQDLIQNYPDIKLFAPCVKLKSTNYYISPGNKRLKRVCSGGKKLSGLLSLKKYGAINSGLLINVNSFIDCGGYNEQVYLDFSDFQFFERFSKHNKYFFVTDIVLQQNLSNSITNLNELLCRFEIYCRCARNCVDKNSIEDMIKYFIVVLGRATKLFIRTRSLFFYKIIFNFFLRRYA
jgi:GT2 family glycosyltransferase